MGVRFYIRNRYTECLPFTQAATYLIAMAQANDSHNNAAIQKEIETD